MSRLALNTLLKITAALTALLTVADASAHAASCEPPIAGADSRVAADAPIDVFLIAGQSNATGVPDDAMGSPRVPPGQVLQYYHGKITDADDPVGNAEPGSAWPQFGITYSALTGHRVLFVPASMTASSITKAGDFLARGHWDETGGLFVAAVKMTDEALRAAGPKARFAGVLWDQGEAEALAIKVRFETAADYEQALKALISRFRLHFGRDTPFFIFETGATAEPDQSGLIAVRTIQQEVSNQTPAAPIVFKDAASFLPRKLMAKNNLHYSQAGYNLMGLEGAQGVAAFYGVHLAGPCVQ